MAAIATWYGTWITVLTPLFLYDRYHIGFKQLVWLNAGSSAAVLFFVPLLPAALLASREESRSATGVR